MTRRHGLCSQLRDVLAHVASHDGPERGVFGGGNEKYGNGEGFGGEGELVLEVGGAGTVPIH